MNVGIGLFNDANNDLGVLRKNRKAVTERVTQLTCNAVADYRTTDRFVDNQPKLRVGWKIVMCEKVENKCWSCNSKTGFCGSRKIFT